MATYFYDTLQAPSKTLVVIFDYISPRVGELTVKAGEEVQVIERIEHWVKAKSKDGKIGMLPLAYLRKPDSIEAIP